ncbi:NAD(P)H nitroreductase [Mycolicibacterium sp. 018/SC-01/001]|uniref:Acg family FMN-binding oxidoreductase n=1 Tax=Mycolicibacterium sp. 018/SC-01/001 TaxID=2592069 RepID=UPI001180FD7E|nr:NAD(P)H nitroreductase [Mycolicibacterium sp. 018/SC-01/001]TRW84800.1 NAD(P)H nitroreductase [Mycolicibacterium sp. 018/SC-01/001]
MPTPHIGSELIDDVLQVACRAPSLHNTQPWTWTLSRNTVDLYLDPSRLAETADDSGRQALLSCGAVLDHFRVALAGAGWHGAVTRFPDPTNCHHLARVTLSPAPTVTPDQRRRVDAIMARRTDRLALLEPPAPTDGLIDAANASEHSAMVHVDVLGADQHSAVAELSHLTDAIRMFDTDYHAELAWWTDGLACDVGVPASALISAPESDRVDVGRNFPVTNAVERRTDIAEDRARILVFSTLDDRPESVLRCGEVLSTVLLEATLDGLATCTVTHVTELATGRDVVASLIGSATIPQALVRVGWAPALDSIPPPTPRRAVCDVLRIRRDAL